MHAVKQIPLRVCRVKQAPSSSLGARVAAMSSWSSAIKLAAQRLVSQNKRRYQDENFDLDCTSLHLLPRLSSSSSFSLSLTCSCVCS